MKLAIAFATAFLITSARAEPMPRLPEGDEASCALGLSLIDKHIDYGAEDAGDFRWSLPSGKDDEGTSVISDEKLDEFQGSFGRWLGDRFDFGDGVDIGEGPDDPFVEPPQVVKDPPSRELAERFLRLGSRDIIRACPNLRTELRRRNVRVVYLPRQVRMPSFTLGLPVISSDGQEALVDFSFALAPKYGHGAIWHLRKNYDGVWAITGKSITSIR